jgi:hypothetical protein
MSPIISLVKAIKKLSPNSNPTRNRCALLGEVHHAAAPFAEDTDEFVSVNLAAHSRYTRIGINGGAGLMLVGRVVAPVLRLSHTDLLTSRRSTLQHGGGSNRPFFGATDRFSTEHCIQTDPSQYLHARLVTFASTSSENGFLESSCIP